MFREFYGTHAAQFGELHLPATNSKHPVAIVVHGGVWINEYSLDLMSAMSNTRARGDRGMEHRVPAHR